MPLCLDFIQKPHTQDEGEHLSCGQPLLSDSRKTAASQGAWVSQLVKHLTSAQVQISWFVSLSPALGCVQILCLPLSLPLPSSHSLALSLSKINKNLKKIRKNSCFLHSGRLCFLYVIGHWLKCVWINESQCTGLNTPNAISESTLTTWVPCFSLLLPLNHIFIPCAPGSFLLWQVGNPHPSVIGFDIQPEY